VTFNTQIYISTSVSSTDIHGLMHNAITMRKQIISYAIMSTVLRPWI
jgi:hypothetical protein